MFSLDQFPPSVLDQWVGLDSNDKLRWLQLARERWFDESSRVYVPVPNRTIELRGELIVDQRSFYCAFGEAVNGPGGYFGSWFHGFDDCLFGGFGLEFPYTVVWRNSEFSKERLDAQALSDWLAEPLRPGDEEWAGETREGWADEAQTFFEVVVNAMRSVPQRSPRSGDLVQVELL